MTLDTAIRIESALGRGIIEVLRDLSEGKVLLSEMAQVVRLAVRTSGEDVTEKEIHAGMWQIGSAESMRVVTDILMQVMGGDNSKEEKEAESV